MLRIFTSRILQEAQDGASIFARRNVMFSYRVLNDYVMHLFNVNGARLAKAWPGIVGVVEKVSLV